MGETQLIVNKGIPILPNLPFGLAYTQGNIFHVKPYSGNDGNTGLTPDKAFKTLSYALGKCTENQNDVVLYYSESNTASQTTDYQSSTLNWNKDLVHLIGVCAPVKVSQRCRITNTASTVVSPVFSVSANGCIIANVQVSNGYNNASALLASSVTGSRNYFYNVHFAGIMGGTTQSASGAADLKIDGGSENVFDNCVIGLDTISRDADATNIIFDTDATRNYFFSCLIQAYISAAEYASVTVADTTGVDRWQIFENCTFFTKSDNKSVTQTSVFSIPSGISQGAIILKNSFAASDGGTVDWDSNYTGIIWNNSVAAAAGAAGGILTNNVPPPQ